MKITAMIVLLPYAVVCTAVEEGALFEGVECDYSCNLYDYTILSHDTSTVSACAVLIYSHSCYNFLYRNDTRMCVCIYLGRLSSKDLAVVNDMMVPSMAQCYTQKVISTCKNEGYTWISELQTCIKVFKSKVNFQTAAIGCLKEGAHLVMPSTPKRTLALSSFLFNQGYFSQYWIGVDDKEVEGRFTWSNGLPVICTNWYPKEPSGGRVENCVRIVKAKNQQYYWRDRECHFLYGYICAEDRNGMIPSG